MGALIATATALGHVNAVLLALGRWLGAACLALMVAIILASVWFRYVIGNALPWPDEASRFLMLWMTGLMAPTAFRRGGFVAIDMVQVLLPRVVAGALQVLLLVLSLVVLVAAFRIGWAEVTGIGGRFATSSLWYPSGLFPLEWAKVPRAWTMMSVHVGVTLLVLVNAELLLRCLVRLGGGTLRPIPEDAAMAGAE